MGILDRLLARRQRYEDVDAERQAIEVSRRVEQATERLASAIDNLSERIERHNGQEKT